MFLAAVRMSSGVWGQLTVDVGEQSAVAVDVSTDESFELDIEMSMPSTAEDLDAMDMDETA